MQYCRLIPFLDPTVIEASEPPGDVLVARRIGLCEAFLMECHTAPQQV
jgi:hypothetical protein